MTVSEEWLQDINESYKRANIPPKQRPWLAVGQWSTETGISIPSSSPIVKIIFDWFESMYPGFQKIGSEYVGSFYFDAVFWPVHIPIVYGSFNVDAWKCLSTMPEKTKLMVAQDSIKCQEYSAIWIDCIDYAYCNEQYQVKFVNSPFYFQLRQSGHRELTASVSLIHEHTPNIRSAECARMATELFLKAYLAAKDGLDDSEAKKIGHDLKLAASKCIDISNNSDLKLILSRLDCFPLVSERYQGKNRPLDELWKAYSTAQFTGTTIVRLLNNRDSRPEIKRQFAQRS